LLVGIPASYILGKHNLCRDKHNRLIVEDDTGSTENYNDIECQDAQTQKMSAGGDSKKLVG
jgi:hypothetical protein